MQFIAIQKECNAVGGQWLTHDIGKRRDDFPEGGEGFVDVRPLLEARALGPGGVCPLRTG